MARGGEYTLDRRKEKGEGRRRTVLGVAVHDNVHVVDHEGEEANHVVSEGEDEKEQRSILRDLWEERRLRKRMRRRTK